MLRAVLAIGGLGFIAVEGWGISTLLSDIKKSELEPSPRTLEQSGIGVVNDSNKLKDKNNKYLVTDSVENFYWWNWVFKYRFLQINKDSLDDHFKYVETGYDTVVNHKKQLSLNKACSKAYEKQISEFSSEDKAKLKNNIKLFCTHEGNKVLIWQ